VKLAVIGAGAVARSSIDLAGEYGHEVAVVADSSSAVVADGSDGRDAGVDSDAVVARKAERGSSVTTTRTTRWQPTTTRWWRRRRRRLATPSPVSRTSGPPWSATATPCSRTKDQSRSGSATCGRSSPTARATSVRGDRRGRYSRGVDRRGYRARPRHRGSRRAQRDGELHPPGWPPRGSTTTTSSREAQDLGVAEADPSFDVDGTDAALKCVILANVLSFGAADDPDDAREFSLDDAAVEGIRDVPGSALRLAAEDGRTVRLIGEATEETVRVAPPGSSPRTGRSRSPGRRTSSRSRPPTPAGSTFPDGAGGPETASAVLGDVGRLQ